VTASQYRTQRFRALYHMWFLLYQSCLSFRYASCFK